MASGAGTANEVANSQTSWNLPPGEGEDYNRIDKQPTDCPTGDGIERSKAGWEGSQNLWAGEGRELLGYMGGHGRSQC